MVIKVTKNRFVQSFPNLQANFINFFCEIAQFRSIYAEQIRFIYRLYCINIFHPDMNLLRLIFATLVLATLLLAQNQTVTYTYVDPKTNETYKVTRQTIQTQTIEVINKTSTSFVNYNTTSQSSNNTNIIALYPNCEKNNGQFCIMCKQGYVLREGYCFIGVIGCEVLGNGYLPDSNIVKCVRCGPHFINDNGRCKDPNCHNYSDFTKLCYQCNNGFSYSFVHNACIDVNCYKAINGVCEECNGGYYKTNSTVCLRKNAYNCQNNPSEKCDSCPDSFFLLLDKKTCSYIIPGCQIHKAETGECLKCYDGLQKTNQNTCIDTKCKANTYPCSPSNCKIGYTFDRNYCLDLNCLTYQNGVCTKCNNGFVSIDNYCYEPTYQCDRFNSLKVCVSCKPGFTLNGGACILHLLEHCDRRNQTNYGICDSCQNGYYVNKDNTCSTISYLCEKFNFTQKSCQKCRNGSQLINGECKDINCIQSNQTDCTKCVPSYSYGPLRKICLYEDPNCADFNDYDGCIGCNRNYILNNGKCEIICIAFESSGKCSSCNQRFYLNTKFECTPKPKDCQSVNPENGECTFCLGGFYLKNKQCMKNPDGCSNYIIAKDQCGNCFNNYNKTNGQCIIIPSDPKCKVANQTNASFCLQCNQNFYLESSSSGKCRLPYCEAYEKGNQTKCSKCQQSTYLQPFGSCTRLNEFCVKNNAGFCVECKEGYTLQKYVCYKSLSGCKAYNEVNKNCSQCDPLLLLTKGACNDFNCQVPGNDSCEKCFDGFSLNAQKICYDNNCETPELGTCKKCVQGFFYNSKVNLCMRITTTNCVQAITPDCNLCPVGYLYRENFGCIKAIAGCVEQPLHSCNKCMNGLNLINNVCQDLKCESGLNYPCATCKQNYFLNSQSICVDRFCKVYSEDKCQQCLPSYGFKNGFCTALPQGCKTYNDRCIQCFDSFFLYFDGICYRKSPETCRKNVHPSCDICPTNYFYQKSTGCFQKISGCERQQKNICLNCISGLALSNNNQCKNMHCANQITPTVCSSCISGYFLVDNFCLLLPQNCSQVNNQGTCLKCAQKYELINSICLQIIPNCLQRNPFEVLKCGGCQPNYYVNQNFKCSERNVR